MIGQLRGRYGNTGNCPYIEAKIHIRAQRLTGSVSFVFDTGADRTLLMPLDGIRIGVDYAALKGAEDTGVSASGPFRTFEEPAVLVFSQAHKRVFAYEITLTLAEPTEHNQDIPSLLGRDVLSHWRSVIKPSTKYLACDVLTADFHKSL